MVDRKHSNNYTTTLNGAITNVATTLVVTSATGLPSIGAGEVYNLTLVGGGNIEIVTVTDDASSPTLTITRGVEGTSGAVFSDGDVIQLRLTADSVDRKQDDLDANALDVVTPSANDRILLQDDSDSDVLKVALFSDFAGGGPAPVVPVVWNSADKAAGVTLSVSDTVATYVSGTRSGAGSTDAKTSGKWYFEVLIGAGPGANQGVGISPPSASRTIDLGQSADTYAYRMDGTTYFDTVFNGAAGYTAGVLGTVIGVAFDIDGGTLEYFHNNTSQGQESVTLNSGTGYVAACVMAAATQVSTIRTESGDFTYTPPSGFSPLTLVDNLEISGNSLISTNTNGDINFTPDGTGVVKTTAPIDFSGATSLEIPNSAAPTVDADGEIAIDTTVTDFSTGVMKIYAGEEQGVVSMPVAEFTSPTDGHVVTYNGTNDEFELAAGGGGTQDFELVSTATASTSASIEFTDLTSHNSYILIGQGVESTVDAADGLFRVSTDNGSTFISTSSYLRQRFSAVLGVTGQSGSASDTSIPLGVPFGTVTGEQGSFKVDLIGLSDITAYTAIMGNAVLLDSNGQSRIGTFSGMYKANTAVDAIQFKMASGNIAKGKFYLYGLVGV